MSESSSAVPTLYDWLGGQPVLERLTVVFYDKVLADGLLRPIFEHMSPEHPRHVALFLGEVLGGPKAYSAHHGGHAGMVEHHLGKGLIEQHRARWVHLLLSSADEIGVPDDPEFRSAFVSYIEWRSRLAVVNSRPGEAAPPADSPMPNWGWGEVGGPYVAPS